MKGLLSCLVQLMKFFVAGKTAEMTSKMGGDNVKLCSSTRADICIFLYIKNVNGFAHRTIIA